MRPSESNEIIEFNVGGSQYTTSRTTIMSCPESMLARMISGIMQTATDSKGRIFIDRDGPLFRHILNYLRDKRLNLPDNFSEYAQLRQEADFYRIESIINDLDSISNLRLNSNKSIVSSLVSSLTSLPNNIHSENIQMSTNKGLYFTIISKLYQGTLETIIGCVRILTVLSTLDSNSKRFLNCLIQPQLELENRTQNGPNTTNSVQSAIQFDTFVCECKFMHEEKLICCRPCGINNTSDQSVTNLCQNIVRIAKRYKITTGYWEDLFYLIFDSSIPNREKLCSMLNSKFNARLLNTCVSDRRTSYDETSTCTLIERWFIPDIGCFSNE